MADQPKKLTKAVFPVAGYGTRFLPVTKAMPKELLPVVDKPLIQYAVEEAVAAGLETLIFVTGRNKRAIEDHFDANSELEAALRAKGKSSQAESIRNILPKGVECIFVRQAEQLGLGHAILCAERAVGNEPFAVLLADDFLIDNGIPASSELIRGFQRSSKIQILVDQVDISEISNFGVVQIGDKKGKVSGLIEKPSRKDAPSNLASIGRYVLTPEIFSILHNISPGVGGEVQLADAINILAKRDKVEAVELDGQRFDCGSIRGFIKAINYEYKRRGGDV